MLQSETLVVGPFRIAVERREILFQGSPVQLGSRAFDVLITLVRRPGQIVTKEELFEGAWAGLTVEDNNLSVQIANVRRLLALAPGGEQWLVTLPGRGYQFIGAVGSDDGRLPRDVKSPPDQPAIAVLPFQNLGGDDYFSDGIVEDIVTALARFSSLFVISRSSSFNYRGRNLDFRKIGEELGVRYILVGSVRKAGATVRLTAQLIDAETTAQVLAEQYDSEIGEIFALQDRLTAGIVGTLVPGIERAEIARVRRTPAGSLTAYDLYLRALAAYHTWTKEGNDEALELVDRVLRLDPRFVPAIILAENCWGFRYTYGWSSVEDAINQSTKFARSAVQLDPENADALAVLARRTASSRDYVAAIELANRAVANNPNSSFVRRHCGWAFAFAGMPEEALSHFDRAVRLSPREARLHDLAGPNNGVALALIQLGRDEEAIAAARTSLHYKMDSVGGWRMLCSALALSGRMDEASVALKRVLELDPTCSLRTLQARFGHSEKARKRFFEGLSRAGLPLV